MQNIFFNQMPLPAASIRQVESLDFFASRENSGYIFSSELVRSFMSELSFRDFEGYERSYQKAIAVALFRNPIVSNKIIALTDEYKKRLVHSQGLEKREELKNVYLSLMSTLARDSFLDLLNLSLNPQNYSEANSQGFIIISLDLARLITGFSSESWIQMHKKVAELKNEMKAGANLPAEEQTLFKNKLLSNKPLFFDFNEHGQICLIHMPNDKIPVPAVLYYQFLSKTADTQTVTTVIPVSIVTFFPTSEGSVKASIHTGCYVPQESRFFVGNQVSIPLQKNNSFMDDFLVFSQEEFRNFNKYRFVNHRARKEAVLSTPLSELDRTNSQQLDRSTISSGSSQSSTLSPPLVAVDELSECVITDWKLNEEQTLKLDNTGIIEFRANCINLGPTMSRSAILLILMMIIGLTATLNTQCHCLSI